MKVTNKCIQDRFIHPTLRYSAVSVAMAMCLSVPVCVCLFLSLRYAQLYFTTKIL